MRSKHSADPLNAFHEGVDFFHCVVESERGAHGSADAQSCHEWFGAMMACSHGDAESVEQGSHV